MRGSVRLVPMWACIHVFSSKVARRACLDADFQCARPCGKDLSRGKELSCGKHSCEKGCHSGSCGECELAGRRTCPCGKVEYKGVTCDRAVPTCGSTCEKSLGCSLHKCQERCHSGPCNRTCRVMLTKACHCGGLKKEARFVHSIQSCFTALLLSFKHFWNECNVIF